MGSHEIPAAGGRRERDERVAGQISLTGAGESSYIQSFMSTTDDAITLTFPRSAVGNLLSLSGDLTDRMHELLERNTDGALSTTERSELETLVQMAHFGQIISMALRGAAGSTA